jgi:hypothetical protein
MHKKYPATRDRRDIGQVVFPIEKMLKARELQSCCVSVEAALETNRGFNRPWANRQPNGSK